MANIHPMQWVYLALKYKKAQQDVQHSIVSNMYICILQYLFTWY